MNGKIWKELHGGMGPLPPKVGGIQGMLFQPSVSPCWDIMRAEFRAGWLMAIIPHPTAPAWQWHEAFQKAASYWWSIAPYLSVAVREAVWGLLHSDLCPQISCVFMRYTGHVSAFTIWLWTLFIVSLSKPFVTLLIGSATMTSYGNNFQKFITSFVKKQKYSYLPNASKIFQFPVILGSFWTSLAPNKEAESQTKSTKMSQMTRFFLGIQSLHIQGSLWERWGRSLLKSQYGIHCTKLTSKKQASNN